MLDYLKEEANLTYTENGALTHMTSGKSCLDLFFRAGAMRGQDERTIYECFRRAFQESPEAAMKILFFARDIRGGLGERRFFRIVMKQLTYDAPDAVERNLPYIAEYGRYDDLLPLIETHCSQSVYKLIKSQLEEDIADMKENKSVSLLAKWLPSVNASSAETRKLGMKIAEKLGMTNTEYRKTLSALRKHIDIIENYLREVDYSFDYSKQPSGAMFKYRNAFIRNDGERYGEYINLVLEGREKLNASTLYPYQIVRRIVSSRFYSNEKLTNEEKLSLDASWKSLPDYENNENAIAIIDGSGSMTCDCGGVSPIDVALSLGIYFAEHSTGPFADHFITFSENPRLVEIKGNDITEKVNNCLKYNEIANTDLEAVFDLILRTAVKNKLTQDKLPAKLYIISDMEFDYCIYGGNNMTMFEAMRQKYAQYGYKLPDIVFWNVCSHGRNIPVEFSETGAALVSGFSPVIFNMVMGEAISPEYIMNKIIFSERYEKIK
ncbi:MAG: DUF2828 family protein [Ruminococcus sp.]|nr:DUF2828 family protein [Ruminococcus sp.]